MGSAGRVRISRTGPHGPWDLTGPRGWTPKGPHGGAAAGRWPAGPATSAARARGSRNATSAPGRAHATRSTSCAPTARPHGSARLSSGGRASAPGCGSRSARTSAICSGPAAPSPSPRGPARRRGSHTPSPRKTGDRVRTTVDVESPTVRTYRLPGGRCSVSTSGMGGNPSPSRDCDQSGGGSHTPTHLARIRSEMPARFAGLDPVESKCSYPSALRSNPRCGASGTMFRGLTAPRRTWIRRGWSG